MEIPSHYIALINQIFEIEKKADLLTEANSIFRNIEKMKNILRFETFGEGEGLSYTNPLAEPYSETRTDCEAIISGNNTNNLKITEVIKPIIRYHAKNTSVIIQKAVVIVSEVK